MLPKPQKEKTAAARISVPLLSIVKQEECEEGLNGDGMDVVRSSLIPNLEDFASRTQIDMKQEGQRAIREFIHKHTCYELIKTSGKVRLLFA